MTPARAAAALLVVGATLATTAGAPQVARAGSYVVASCSPSSTPGAWQQTNSFSAGLSSGNECGGPASGPLGITDQGALYGEDLVGSTAQIPNGAQAGWTLTAPSGTEIAAVSYYRSLATGNDLDWVAGLFAADGTAIDTCQSNPSPCSSPNNQVPVSRVGLNTASLFFGVKCVLTGADQFCLAGGTQHDAQADLYSARVTISETTTPSVSGVGGPLWGGGVVWGTAPLSFSAADPSGIAQVTLGGTTLSETCDFSQAQPCPQLPSGSLSVDTTRLSDGAQTISLFATNAAGITASAQSPPLVIDNNGPPPPIGFVATPAGGGSNTVRLAWTNPARPPEPITAGYAQLCQTSCGSPTSVGTSGAGQVIAPAAGAYTVRLWLTDSQGRGGPANAATTTATVSPSGNGPVGGSRLRISHRLRGRRLTITVRLPAGTKGRITVSLDLPRGKRLTLLARHRPLVRRGLATTVFVLSRRALQAHQLTVAASAPHVGTGRIAVHVG
jgi:hypothetical protein